MTPNPAPISAPLSEAGCCHSPACSCPQIPSGMTLTLILTPNIGDLSRPARAEPHSPSSVGLSQAWEGSSGPQGLLLQLSLTEITTELPPVGLGAAQAQPPERLRVSMTLLDVAVAGFVPCPPPLALSCPSSGMPDPSGMEWESRGH